MGSRTMSAQLIPAGEPHGVHRTRGPSLVRQQEAPQLAVFVPAVHLLLQPMPACHELAAEALVMQPGPYAGCKRSKLALVLEEPHLDWWGSALPKVLHHEIKEGAVCHL